MNDIEHLLVEIPLHFETDIFSDVFKDKNNSTLKETIESSRYKPLYDTVLKKYPHELETNVGDFLFHLKSEGDEFIKSS